MTIIPSNYAQTYSSQRVMEELQNELRYRQSEISTGRKSDLTLSLGYQIRQNINIHSISYTLDTYLSNNRIINARLESTQLALTNISKNADEFKSSLIQVQNDSSDRNIIRSQASNFLNLFISSLNTSSNSGYIFGGEKINLTPVNIYSSNPPSSAYLAINEAFSSEPPSGFGFSQTSSLVSTITSDQLESFINGSLTNLFSEIEWSKNWSEAGNTPIKDKISPVQKITTSITSHDPALRKIAMAYVMMSDLGSDKMNTATYQVLTRRATAILDEGIKLLNSSRAQVGVMQQSIQGANDLMLIQSNIMEIQLSKLESADQSNVAARINNLLSRIEASYALTARISRLSLTNYL